MKANPKTVKGEDKRFTILHAGCVDGFLKGCDLMLDTQIEHRDYHQTMNGDSLGALDADATYSGYKQKGKKCVIIMMDNAPYHSVRQVKNSTSNSNKDVYIKWLRERNISFEEHWTKKQLLGNYKTTGQVTDPVQNSYVIDNLFKSHGHEVLPLPPYNCQYDPIGLEHVTSCSRLEVKQW